MTSNCLVCGSVSSIQPSLPQVIDTFKVVLQVLETQVSKFESENAEKIEKLHLQLNDATARYCSLEEDKTNAEKRSDLYKERFLDAQKAIQQLHDKNIQLSNRRTQKTSPRGSDQLRHISFASDNEFSPDMRKVILAPDTCAVEAEPHQEDYTYISSDEEDFKQEHKGRNKKSPKSEKLKAPTKSVMESFFAKPKSPPKSLKRKNFSFQTPKSCSDMDETRLDVDDAMDTSISFEPSKLVKLDQEMDSMPPSPVLSGGKERRFGLFRRPRQSLPKSNDNPDKANVDSGQQKSDNTFCSHRGLEEDNAEIEKESQRKATVSRLWRDESVRLDSTLTQHLGQRTAEKETIGNTSLDELFDKTFGDLETTTMLKNFDAKDDDAEEEESDEELDALLLEGVGDAMLNPTPDGHAASSSNSKTKNIDVKESISSLRENRQPRKLSWEDSFDVLPKKMEERKFKYQEVVRKRNERDKLAAKACAQCEAYYSDLPEEEREEVMRKACRHKHVHAPPSTPEHFWEIGIPSTEECRRRGYITDEKDLPPEERNKAPRLRRKKPLEPFFFKKR